MTKAYNIVHLEDNPDVAERIAILFDNENNVLYQHVSTEQEAFEVLDTNIPDLLIVDLMLIDDDDASPGVSFIKQAYEKYPGIKMMVLSNRGDQKFRDDLKPYIIDYEVKIFRPSIYKNKIIKLLKQMDDQQ